MKRLSDLPAEDRLTSRVQALIRAAGPTVESEERLRYVRRSLEAPARAATPRWGSRVGLALGLRGLSAVAAAWRSAVSRELGIEQSADSRAAQATPPSRIKVAIPSAAATAPPPERAVEAARSPRPTKLFVTGPLAEEALALRIKASVARGNGWQGRLAAVYLAHYPQGRYRELARKALSGSKQ